MNSKTPIVRQIAWISLVPHLLVIGLIMFIWYQIDKTDNHVIYGAITYFLISQSLRRFVAKDHRKGMINVKQEKFEEAIPYFEKSYKFFKENDWVDKYRFVTVLSSSRITYKEMALSNIAFCYGQLGNGKLAKEYYERALKEYPNSVIAKSALKMLNSMSDND